VNRHRKSLAQACGERGWMSLFSFIGKSGE
jgi:hypothetical protein